MIKRSTIFLSLVMLVFSFFVLPESVYAQGEPLRSPDQGIVPCGDAGEPRCDVCQFIVLGFNIITFLRNLIVIACIVVITIAGVIYIVSAGNTGMITTAKNALKYALLGVLVILFGWVVVTFIIRSIALDQRDKVPANGSVGLYVQEGSLWTFDCNAPASASK